MASNELKMFSETVYQLFNFTDSPTSLRVRTLTIPFALINFSHSLLKITFRQVSHN